MSPMNRVLGLTAIRLAITASVIVTGGQYR